MLRAARVPAADLGRPSVHNWFGPREIIFILAVLAVMVGGARAFALAPRGHGRPAGEVKAKDAAPGLE